MSNAAIKEAEAETNVAAEELRAFIERIERLEEEKQTIADEVKDVYGEAKGRGYGHARHAENRRHPQDGPERARRDGRHSGALPSSIGDDVTMNGDERIREIDRLAEFIGLQETDQALESLRRLFPYDAPTPAALKRRLADRNSQPRTLA